MRNPKIPEGGPELTVNFYRVGLELWLAVSLGNEDEIGVGRTIEEAVADLFDAQYFHRFVLRKDVT